jgi:hypothetical protein
VRRDRIPVFATTRHFDGTTMCMASFELPPARADEVIE